MDKNNIKSKDLCERCEYNYIEYCYSQSCAGCAMNDRGVCNCSTVHRGTPCPYFREQGG